MFDSSVIIAICQMFSSHGINPKEEEYLALRLKRILIATWVKQ